MMGEYTAAPQSHGARISIPENDWQSMPRKRRKERAASAGAGGKRNPAARALNRFASQATRREKSLASSEVELADQKRKTFSTESAFSFAKIPLEN